MDYFTKIEGSILLTHSGSFRQAELFQNPDGEIYTKRGVGYVRLWEMGQTSVRGLSWKSIPDTPEHHFKGGRMILGPQPPQRQVRPVTRKKAA